MCGCAWAVLSVDSGCFCEVADEFGHLVEGGVSTWIAVDVSLRCPLLQGVVPTTPLRRWS